MTSTLAYWIEAPGRGALRERPLAPAAGDVVDVVTECSGISPGTERLVGTGQVPAACERVMRVPGMLGTFALPACYGYSLVGTARGGALDGRRVFTMQPHQQRALVAADACVPLPLDVPAARGTLLPNLETALNAVWDAELAHFEAVLVIGAGAVGSLIAFALAQHHEGRVVVVERDAERRRRAAALPWIREIVAPEDVPRDQFDVALHATGHAAGLQLGLDALAFEGRLVELSWYGARPVTVDLGAAFHYRRLRIVASQVAHIAPSHRSLGREVRTASVLALLRQPQLDALLAPAIPFAELPQFFARLYRGEPTEPCPVVAYSPR